MIARFLGRLLRGVHAGEEKLVWNQAGVRLVPDTIVVESSAFADGGAMPERFAAKGIGVNLSPPLTFSKLPTGTAEVVVVMEDPDAPLPVAPVHLVATGIAPGTREFAQGAFNPEGQSKQIRLGKGMLGRRGYAGPRPPPGHGAHRYVFQVYALDRGLSEAIDYDRTLLLRHMEGRILARGRLTGMFGR